VRNTGGMKPHPITPDLIPALHRLNQDHALELSSLSLAEFTKSVNNATRARALGPDGLLLTFDQDADYDSTNFLWFRERYEQFVYVDRIVIAPSRRGQGFARLFYEDLFVWAQAAQCPRITAEYNSDPPNPASEAFHTAMGFEPVAEAILAGRGKSVRYVTRPLAP